MTDMTDYIEDAINEVLAELKYENELSEEVEDFIYELIEYLEEFLNENIADSLDNIEDTIFRVFVDDLGNEYTKEFTELSLSFDRETMEVEDIKCVVIQHILENFCRRLLRQIHFVMKDWDEEEMGIHHLSLAITQLNSVRERVLKQWDLLLENESSEEDETKE